MNDLFKFILGRRDYNFKKELINLELSIFNNC